MTESTGQERWASPLDGPDQSSQAGLGQEQDPVIGTPETDTGTWDGVQSFDDTCSIRCQEFILEQFTGQEISEEALVQMAQDNGLYEPGAGTLPSDVGKLLDMNGIPTSGVVENATAYDLAIELAQGHKVMIGVDSGELWGEENPIMEDMATIAPTDAADHSVIVSGIDTTDPNNPQVIVSDPGTGDPAATYPLDQFVSAWQDSNFQMVSTQDPAPPALPEMANFDYEAGHIPEVMGVPYEDFTSSAYDEAVGTVSYPTEVAPAVSPEAVAPTVDPALLDPNAPGATLDPALLDPSIPGPTVNPVLLDPMAPSPTVDPALLDPSMPGPTIDPALLDPTVPGPTVAPTLLDPAAPGPFVDPSLLDPNVPGPTIDPSLLDPMAPGVTVDPALLDPAAPGTTIDPSLLETGALAAGAGSYGSLPPELTDLLNQSNQVISESQDFIEQVNVQQTTRVAPMYDPVTGYPVTDPGVTYAPDAGIPQYVLDNQAEIAGDIQEWNAEVDQDWADSFDTFNTE